MCGTLFGKEKDKLELDAITTAEQELRVLKNIEEILQGSISAVNDLKQGVNTFLVPIKKRVLQFETLINPSLFIVS